MKIPPLDTQHIHQDQKPQSGQAGNGAFEKILENKIRDSNAAKAQATTSAHVHNLQHVAFTPPVSRDAIMAQVSELLEVMEEYAARLGDSRSTLREIAPLVASIEAQNNDLQALADHIPPDDSLRDMLEETLIRASVEVEKFNRGDYLGP